MKEAKIISIKKNKITASITADTMCKTCPSSTHCFIKDCSKKEIEITTTNPKQYQVNDIINVQINASSSFYALLFAYIFPLFILLSVFYSLRYLQFAEISCGVFSIFSLTPYYFLLLLNKEKIANKTKVQINDN